MILDMEQELPEIGKADVCVVGAGAAGIVLTLELLNQGKRVLLLEGGGRELEDRSQDPYRSEVIGHVHRGIHVGRFRAHGGTTVKWGGQILEFDEIDFEKRDWIAGSGWPFPKQTLRECYDRAIVWEGIGKGTLSDQAVWKEIGAQPFPKMQEVEQYFSRWCLEPNFARLHRQGLEHNERLTIVLHANAIGFAWNESGSRATGVVCRTLDGKERTFTAGKYVFCLGTIETSRFLLQPESDGRNRWNQSDLLGAHFQDHIDCNTAEIRIKDNKRFHDAFDNVFSRGYKYHPKLRLRPEKEREEKTLQAAATMYFVSDIDDDLAKMKSLAKAILRRRTNEISMGGIAHMAANLPLLLQQSYRYKVKRRAFNPSQSKVYLRVHCEQEPLSPSSITLSEEKDALGLRRARLDWRITPFELKTLRKTTGLMQSALRSMGVAEVVPDASLADDAALTARCDDSNHHMGGARMSDSPSDGVVDTNLKLHAAENVYCASGAVFPTSGFSNPTHTLLALTVRLADHLR